MVDLDLDEVKIDIHHIFPKEWCKAQAIPPRVFNAIINKTPISYKANRKIGKKPPSEYLSRLQAELKIHVEEQDEILRSHLISPPLLRADDFASFFADRKAALLKIVSDAMGKPAIMGGEPPAEDAVDDEEDDQTDAQRDIARSSLITSMDGSPRRESKIADRIDRHRRD